MKKLLMAISLLFCMNIGFAQCSGSVALSGVPVRTTTTLTDGLRIGDGGSGVIKVCVSAQFTSGKCGGNKPGLYAFIDGSGLDVSALVMNWTTEHEQDK